MVLRLATLLLLGSGGCHLALPLDPTPGAPDGAFDLSRPDALPDAPDGAPPDATLPDAAPDAAPDARPDAPLPGCELTEGNASQWSAACNIPGCGTPAPCSKNLLFDDLLVVQEGQSSIRWKCVGCAFDNALKLERPGGGEWDASSFKWLRFWIRSDVVDPSGWQDGECGDNPLIVLADPFGHKWVIQKSGAKPDLNDSRSKWLKVEVPLVPGLSPQWQVIDHSGGMFKLAKVKTIEIHVDPWGYGGFSLWVDGLTFVDDAGNTLTDCGI